MSACRGIGLDRVGGYRTLYFLFGVCTQEMTWI